MFPNIQYRLRAFSVSQHTVQTGLLMFPNIQYRLRAFSVSQHTVQTEGF